jgi:hypothetical protein
MKMPVELACWRALACSESCASFHASAASHRFPKDVGVFTIIESELKLREVQGQVFSTYVVIGAHDSALKETPKVLHAVRVDLAANVFTRLMIDGLMRVLHRLEPAITAVFVSGNQTNAICDRLANEATKRTRVGILDHFAEDIAFASDSADDCDFAGIGCAASAVFGAHLRMTVALLAADVRFIDLNNSHQLLEIWIVHGCSQAVAHIPSRLVGLAADLPLNLECADTFLGIEHLPEHFEPNFQGVLGVLENRSRRERETVGVTLPAGLVRALPFPCKRDVVDRFGLPASRTCRAIRPTPKEEKFSTGFISRESFHQLSERHHG